jgi:hypothetical protein
MKKDIMAAAGQKLSPLLFLGIILLGCISVGKYTRLISLWLKFS